MLQEEKEALVATEAADGGWRVSASVGCEPQRVQCAQDPGTSSRTWVLSSCCAQLLDPMGIV